MKTIKILETPVSLVDLKMLAEETYQFMIKGSVDIEQKRVAVGGDYHIESCRELELSGSSHSNVWGFNVVFGEGNDYTIEYDSLINIKPALGNRTRNVDDSSVREQMQQIVTTHITV